jgi:hypothetical protein
MLPLQSGRRATIQTGIVILSIASADLLGPSRFQPKFGESGTCHSNPGKLQGCTPGHRTRYYASNVVEDLVLYRAFWLLLVKGIGQQWFDPHTRCPPFLAVVERLS